VLSTDEVVPPGLAVYAPAWREDVMLRGGRISRTPDLAPGAERMFEGSLEMLGTPASPYHYLKFPIPTGTPAGNYFVCAVIDSNRVIAEDNEINNVTCHRVRLGMPMLRVPVDPLPRLPQQPRVPQQPRLPNQN